MDKAERARLLELADHLRDINQRIRDLDEKLAFAEDQIREVREILTNIIG